MKVTAEMLEKAKNAKSAEEFLAPAKENDILLTENEAVIFFNRLAPANREIDDGELDNVSGGGCSSVSEEMSETKFNVGDHVMLKGRTKCGPNYKSSTCNSPFFVVKNYFYTTRYMYGILCPYCNIYMEVEENNLIRV